MGKGKIAKKSDAELGDGDNPTAHNKPLKQKLSEQLREHTRIARFKGATVIEDNGLWVDMSSDRFSETCYGLFGHGTLKSKISDLEHLFRTTAEDLSGQAQYMSFGGAVWDSKELDWTEKVTEDECVYRVPYQPQKANSERIPFVMDLACGDEGVYDDIMQSVAPLIMDKKPTGVIWYLGGGANGKSTLVHLLYLIFGPYLTELTVKQLEDERDTPQLNGKLGNVCKESSEGFVEDTKVYKCIGTHESFGVHKFHSQDMVKIEGNVHHIFSANNIPTFGDKSYGARRRTLVIPFSNTFKPDETFEDRTFTVEFIESFVAEMIKYALQLKEQGYEYKFHSVTKAMKEKYDTAANTAQTYAEELMAQDIKGFLNYRQLAMDYENWCSEHGYTKSTLNVLRRAMDDKDFTRSSARDENGKQYKVYLMGKNPLAELVKVPGRGGLYQLKGSKHEAQAEVLGEEKQEELLKDWSNDGEQQSTNTREKEYNGGYFTNL